MQLIGWRELTRNFIVCSILVTDKKIDNFDEVNYFLKFRGPDDTNFILDEVNNFSFVHNLLSITGDKTNQPFVQDGVVCLYNGEIYNYKEFGDYDSDGYCLVDLYKEFGVEFVKKLDGEFSICLLDFTNDKIIIATDPFKTKPLFYSNTNNSFGSSTYETPLKKIGHEVIKKAKPNTAMVFKMSTSELVEEFTIVEWDLNQTKNHFEDWNRAFELSISKRAKDASKKVFIGLSSGYDSGVICCELMKQKIPFKAYTVHGTTENMSVLNERHKLFDDDIFELEHLYKSVEIREQHRKLLKEHTERFAWTIRTTASDYTESFDLADERGSAWMSLICSNSIKEDRKIYLSGVGGDEIFSDYGFNGRRFTKHSNFGGLFPEDLTTIFPWPSFYYSSMESYIAKEEYVTGVYGVEGRYPYLDKKVVQEFLSLSHNLKNSQYKSVLDNYFVENNYKYSRGKKVGF